MTQVRVVIQRITIFVLIPAIARGHLNWISYKSIPDVKAATYKVADRSVDRKPGRFPGIRNDAPGNDVYHNIYITFLHIILN